MSGFKVGDEVVYCNDKYGRIEHLVLGKNYIVNYVSKDDFVSVGHSHMCLTPKRFRKIIKRKDNPILRKLVKVIREENGYVYY